MATLSTESLIESLNNPSNAIGMRMRATYYLRQAHDNSVANREVQEKIISALGNNLLKINHGSLMRHEMAYVMGQLRDSAGCVYLEQALAAEDDCIMVRHECAEALGSIGRLSSLAVLENFVLDVHPEVSQTCRIAIDFVQWKASLTTQEVAEENHANEIPPVMVCACMLSPYKSVDPAPPLSNITTLTANEIIEFGSVLLDQSVSLFQRYRAMFTLRNMNTAQSATELGNALIADQSSALLRHEIAYVLGQMQNPASIPMLVLSLSNKEEHVMVRHESAEALGAMCDLGGVCWEECKKVLQHFQSDGVLAVAESCQVALDAADYWETFSSSNHNRHGEADGKATDRVSGVTFAAQKASSGSPDTICDS